MKKLSSILLTLCLPLLLSAQDLLTIGEVFDFAIGDEFQFTEFVIPETPNADRITIIDKYYSSDSSTVFYTQFHNSYYTKYYGQIIYYYWTRTETVSYSTLDSSITSFDLWRPYDTSMFYYDTINFISEIYCDSVLNGFHYLTHNSSPEVYSNVFGKGLGWVRNYYSYPAENNMFNNELFYYKKNGIECGTPDLNYVSVYENNVIDDFKISPNPANQYFSIRNKTGEPLSIEIYNIAGKLISSKNIDSNNSRIECNSLSPGMYVVCILSDSKKIFRKLIIQ